MLIWAGFGCLGTLGNWYRGHSRSRLLLPYWLIDTFLRVWMFQSISFWNWSFKDPDDEMIETETQELNQETKRNQQTQKSSKIEEQGIIVWVNLFSGCFCRKIDYFCKYSPLTSYIREDTRNCLWRRGWFSNWESLGELHFRWFIIYHCGDRNDSLLGKGVNIELRLRGFLV